jgi:hypothetical protein
LDLRRSLARVAFVIASPSPSPSEIAIALVEGDLRYARSRALPFDRALLAARGLFPARRLPFRN